MASIDIPTSLYCTYSTFRDPKFSFVLTFGDKMKDILNFQKL